MLEFPRITIRPDEMGGVACIRGLRIPVSVVVDMVADGIAATDILKNFPDLEAADISAALKYAAELAARPIAYSNGARQLIEKARQNANLGEDEARRLGLEETRADRLERRGNG